MSAPSDPPPAETPPRDAGDGQTSRTLVRSPVCVGLGAFLILTVAVLVLVVVDDGRAPGWVVGAGFVLAPALALVIAAFVPVARRGGAHRYTSPNGIDPAITGEPREEQPSYRPGPAPRGPSAQ